MAQREILVDENKRLCDVRPFLAVLNIIERQEDKADYVLNAQISSLIGKGMYYYYLCMIYALCTIYKCLILYYLLRSNGI